jgi:nucleotide-binding universal stress UspA family protein
LIGVNVGGRALRDTFHATHGGPMKILIAVDGSDYTKHMLAYLAAHEEWFGAKHSYTVIHCVLAVPHRAAAFVGQKAVQEYYESDAELVFRPIRAFFAQNGLEATFVHTVGRVGESIAQLAEEGKFELVVMGSHGHGEVLNMVLGSVATKVLAKCSVPVLLVR